MSNVDRGSKKAQQSLPPGRRDVDLLAANNNTFLPILPKLSPSDYQEIQREGAGKIASICLCFRDSSGKTLGKFLWVYLLEIKSRRKLDILTRR